MEEVSRQAREASYVMQSASTEMKNACLEEVANQLSHRKAEVVAANQKDKAAALANKVDATLQKRLNLEGDKFTSLLKGLRQVATVEDPVGKCLLATKLDQGLDLFRVAAPLGVLCIIFESRPEAAVQIASLAIKSGNALILKGGKEAVESNTILAAIFRDALEKVGLPKNAVQLVHTRSDIQGLLAQEENIDLVIPRGSNALVRHVMDNTKIPVLGHADGICHTYVDKEVDAKMAARIVVDGKTQYPAVCNATETVLVHKDLVGSQDFKDVVTSLSQAKDGVTIHACAVSKPILDQLGLKNVLALDEPTDFRNEYLVLECNLKVVDSLDSAIAHINKYSSHHTDAIVSNNVNTAEEFLRRVDSANVFHNASTRFADGFRYGFGSEVGVSTSRIHARGPVGLEGLLTYKYRIHGHGQVVDDFSKKEYLHESMENRGRKVSLLEDDDNNRATKKQKH